MINNNLEKIIDFLHEAGKLKTTLRFAANEIIKGDSSADHSWRLALMAFLIAEELNLKIDKYKAIKIALIHDLAEALAGDIDARLIHSNIVSKEEKVKRERQAIKKLGRILPQTQKNELVELWEEYENKSTPEARFIKALDKLETQAKLLEEGYKTYDMPDLIATSATSEVKDFPQLLDMLLIIKKKIKQEFKKGHLPWKEEYNVKYGNKS